MQNDKKLYSLKSGKCTCLLCSVFLCLFITACHTGSVRPNRAVIIQPFIGFSHDELQSLYNAIHAINPKTTVATPIALPPAAWYAPRQRYRADSLVAYLKRMSNDSTIIIGLTNKDISTAKGNIADWGIMGLADRPGSSCVVSSFRLSGNKVSQLCKVSLHELGHTEGLPHCSNSTCFMRAAEGGNPTDHETGFCPKCKAYLKELGWRLQ